MHEEGKQPQYMQEREYKKLFGLEIYLTPVFVISSITIVAFIVGTLIFINLQERNLQKRVVEQVQKHFRNVIFRKVS